MTTHYDQQFESKTFTDEDLYLTQFESCTFKNCQLRDLHFKDLVFEECEFYACDFSGTHLNQSAMRTVQFHECKLIGLNFENIKPFRLSMKFYACLMDYTTFYKLKLQASIFENCALKGADFTEANLTKANLSGSKLDEAVFQQSNLSQADFRNCTGYIINPIINQVRGAKFSKDEIHGLLVNFAIRIE